MYLGSLGYYGYLCRSEALLPLPCLQQYLTVRPVASALEAQDICHLIVTTPVPTILVLNAPSPPISSLAMLFLLQHSPSVIGLHFRPLIACPLCALSNSLQAFAVGFKLLTPLYNLVQLSLSFLVSVMSLLLANASRWTPFRLQKEHWKHRSVQQRAPQGEPQNQLPNPWHPSALCTF